MMADVAIVDSRPLSAQEQAVLDLLLSVDYPGADELRQQAASALVIGRCDCGCPTFDVGVGEECPVAVMPHGTAPVELRVLPTAGELEGSILLFIDGGRMASVEYVYYSDEVPKEWPEAARIALFDRTR